MRRFGDPESFLGLLAQIREHAPEAGVRSNVIVGFPGETEDDLETLCEFLVAARMDVTGVFGYSDEDGTEAASYDGKLDDDEIRARVEHVSGLVEELTSQRAEERVGETVEVLVEDLSGPFPSAARPCRARRSTAPPAWSAHPPACPSATSSRQWWSRATGSTSSPGRPEAIPRDRDRGAGQQPEPAQRPDHPSHRDGALLRLGAAARGR